MTDMDTRLDAAERKIAAIAAVVPDLNAAYHALSSQSGSQTVQGVAFDRELARLARAVDTPTHLDVTRAQATDAVRRLDVLDARTATHAPATGVLETAWTFGVNLGLKVAAALGLDKRPVLALVYILVGSLMWGAVNIYRDFKEDIRGYVRDGVAETGAQAAANEARAAADRERIADEGAAADSAQAETADEVRAVGEVVDSVKTGVDSLVTGAAPDAP